MKSNDDETRDVPYREFSPLSRYERLIKVRNAKVEKGIQLVKYSRETKKL